jgi:hypothetical protein
MKQKVCVQIIDFTQANNEHVSVKASNEHVLIQSPSQ